MKQNIDVLIVGAGPVGCVLAERMASVLGWKVLIIDKRNHIAGNCYDSIHESGVLIHNYGPHYFRTNSESLLDYLTNFTEWLPSNYIVKSSIDGELFPFPINLLTLRQFFKVEDLDETSAKKLLQEKQIAFPNPKNSEEFVLTRVGRELYEAFYLGYTLKQWEIHPRDLAPSVLGRIPVRLNEDCRYVDHKYQQTPKDGFTKMFEKMIDHPNISLSLGVDFNEVRHTILPEKLTIYTGPIDEYFGFRYGKLPWRSLAFRFDVVNQAYVQPCVQINYPQQFDYTRTVEIKHVTMQNHPQTVVSYEYPKAEGDPFYPIPMEQNHLLYEQYKALAVEETEVSKVYFCGRLAEYKYFNTDEVIERALNTFETIKKRYDY